MENRDGIILFVGGDKRQGNIYKSLLKSYQQCRIIAYGENEYSDSTVETAEIIVLPTVATADGETVSTPLYNKTVQLSNLFSHAMRCKCIIAGMASSALIEKAASYGIDCYEYVSDQGFKTLNAIPTAEGALAIAAENSDITIWNSKCLVIGCGCIGRRLAELLKALGANVTVSARKPHDAAFIKANNYCFTETKAVSENIGDFDFIFNTVPHRVIANKALLGLKEKTVVIELASKPYGIDFDAAKDAKCRVIAAPSLPGRFSPVTAAEIAKTAIERIIKEVQNNE